MGPVVAIVVAVEDPVAILKAVVSDWDSVVGLAMAIVGFRMSWRAPEKAR